MYASCDRQEGEPNLGLLQIGAGQHSAMAYRVCVFGKFSLHNPDGLDVTPRGRKAAALLCCCLAAAPKPVRRERLAELLWGNRGEEQARASLRQVLYELRGVAVGGDALLAVDRAAVRAEPAAFVSDLDRLHDARTRADAVAMIAILEDTSEELLADLSGISPEFDDWLTSERVCRRDERRRLAIEVAEQALANGQAGSSRRIAESLLAGDPLDEAAARLAIDASAALGEIDHGRRIFARLEASLLRDLGVAPSADSVAANERLGQGGKAATRLLPGVPVAEELQLTARATKVPIGVKPWLRASPFIPYAVCISVLLMSALTWIWLRPTGRSGKHVVVEQLAVDAGDSPSRLLRQSLATDLVRMVVGNDTTLDFADQSDETGAKGNADYFVSGDARSNAGTLYAAVRLIDAGNKTILWSRDFAGSTSEVDALRQRMASKIADVLVCAFGSRSKRPASIDVATLRLFLAGCENWHTDWPTARGYFEQVVRRAPDFAQARAMYAGSLYLSTGTFSGLAQKDWEPLQQEAVRQAQIALAQDPHLGAAYFALAGSMKQKGMESVLARYALLQKGVLADPDDGAVQTALGVDLSNMGMTRDATLHAERAAAVDPFAPIYAANLAEFYGFGGRLADSIRLLDQGSRSWPNEFYTSWIRFEVAARVGDPAAAEAMLDDPTRNPGYSPQRAGLWRAFLEARKNPAPAQIDKTAAMLMLAEPTVDPQGRVEIIQDLVQLGRIDQAYAVALHPPAIPYAWNYIWFRDLMAPFRRDQRFLQFLKLQHYPPHWLGTGQMPDFCSEPKLAYRCPT